MKKLFFGVLAAVLLVAAVAAAGGMAFRMGYAQGAIAAQSQVVVAEGQPSVAPGVPAYPRAIPGRGGYGMPMPVGRLGPMMGGFHPFGGLVGLLIGLFVLAVVIRIVARMAFGRHMMGGYGPMRGCGPMGDKGRGVPPWVEEWHRKQHEPAAPPTGGDAPAA